MLGSTQTNYSDLLNIKMYNKDDKKNELVKYRTVL